MDERLLRFFKKINFNDVASFDECTLKECIVNKKDNYWTLKINSKNIININSLISLITLCKDGIEEVKKINIEMFYENEDDKDILDYFIHFLRKEIDNNKSLSTIDLDKITCVDKTINIIVATDMDKLNIKQVQKNILHSISLLGINDIKVNVELDEKENKQIIADIEKIKSSNPEPVYYKSEPTDNTPFYMRKKKVDFSREGNVSISSIKKEENACNIDAYIFKNQFDEIKKRDGGTSYLMTLWISDNTYSIKLKKFAKDEEEFKEFGKTFKEGNWFHFVGDVREDRYEKDLVFNMTKCEPIDSPIIKRKDSSPRKRVELHAHTMMSQMDGIIDEGVLVKQAMSWGMPGIAITDHDGCQAFPVVFDAVTKYNKGKKKEFDEKIAENEKALEELRNNDSSNKEGIKQIEEFINELKDEKEHFKPFKALYGVELDMCESFLNVCFNPNDELLKDNTYVVFDTETTGFNAGLGNSMIEIGGVKVKDGEIIDRYDSLINPGCKIDPEITRVTNITDDDVKDAKDEETVIKEFKEWIGSLPLVAHNARFDKSMLDMAYYKYNLGELTNPIIDTLMLSRVINRDLKRHSLAALGKAYGVDTGEADEEESSGEVSSSDYKIDENEIEDILVDGESILKVVDVEYQDTEITTEEVITKIRHEYYLPTIYKASKTEEINIEVKLKDGYTLMDFNPLYKLHAAENQCTFTYMTPFGPKSVYVSVYVGEHHGADVDSENTAIIFNKMLKQIDGVEKISDLNNLGLLEEVSIKNNQKYKEHIGDISSYKNYVRLIDEDEEVPEDTIYPFEKYGNKNYVWKYSWCHEDNLQMYENIPAKTFTEHLANMYDGVKHITLIAKDQVGLKNLFKIISYANSNFMQRNARIPRKLVNEFREGILVGSACLNGEIFNIAEMKNEEELAKAMEFYDYIEIQPLENYEHLLRNHDINNMNDLKKLIKKIIKVAQDNNKLIVATGDVHILNKEDNLYREIIVNQNVPGKGRHVLARYLNGYKRNNVNLDNIEDAIKKAAMMGRELSTIDIKVLKYIYALQATPSIPITSSTICNLYVINKNNPDEIRIKNKDEERRSVIDASLRKLNSCNIISIDYTGVYYLTSKYTKGEKYQEGHIPAQYFRTTEEMLDAFKWLKDDKLAEEIVIDNTYKIMDQVDVLEVILHPHKPFSPIIEHSQETCRDLVFTKAQSMYGDPLPRNIEERIAEEFYGGTIYQLVDDYIEEQHPGISEEEKDKIYSSSMHEVVMNGFDFIVELFAKRLMREDESLDIEAAKVKAKDSLSGIIGGGFDVIYLIAQKLVKHSNDRGYLVGSRGSVGSSFVASMMGITECNSLPPHYYCPDCKYSMFKNEDGKDFTYIDEQGEEQVYLSGFDLPERDCPKCGAHMIHQGNDMPFATFLGFQGEKVPDIDLNFSGDDQPYAHDYTKVLFGTDNVYRAGTIATVADKTAFGYVQGFFEEKLYDRLKNECKMYGLDVTGKDDLKREKIIVSDCRVAEVERLAVGCTGVKRTTGQHPGGIVVVPGYKDVFDFTPFQYPADDPTAAWRTTHFDYHKIEDDLLKLDILGHDDPTVLRMLQDLSGIDVTQIDLGDKDTMSIFTGPEVLGVKPNQLRGLVNKETGEKYCPTGTLGIPEFGTAFLLGMLEETKPKTFAELIKISGLSHGTDVWLGNARDLIINNVVPFSKVIGCRDDIMVNLIAWGVPAGKAFKIMEFVRKGKPSKDPAGWQEHVKTLKEYNIPDYYIDSCRKIKYMFPKAHATAYVTSAFRIAWFKVHHPIWYYCAYLSIRRDQFDIASMVQGENAIRAKIDEIDAKPNPSNKEIDTRDTLQICLEAACRGIYFKNVDLNKSDAKHFVITEDQKGLIIPFRAIDGLGENVAISIVKARNEAPFISQEDLKIRGKVSGSTIDKFKELGCIDDMPESNQLSLF